MLIGKPVNISNSGFAVYGPDQIGAAPTTPPILNGFKDGSGNVQAVAPGSPFPTTGATAAAQALSTTSAAALSNSTYPSGAIPTPNAGGISVAVAPASGITVVYEWSPDGSAWYFAYGDQPSNSNNVSGNSNYFDTSAAQRTFPVLGGYFRVRALQANATATSAYVQMISSPAPVRTVTAQQPTGTTWAVGQADGADVTLGAKADAASAATGSSLMAIERQLHSDLVGPTPTPQAGPALGPAAALGVVQQDGQTLTLSGSAAGPLTGTGTNATTGAISTAGYQSVDVQIVGAGAGNTITTEFSNDGATWVSGAGYQVGNIGNAAPSSATASVELRVFPALATYVRVRISAYGSGTVTAVLALKVTPVAPIATYVTQGSRTSQAGWSTNGDVTAASGGLATFSRLVSTAATTNLTQAKAAAGRVYKIVACNTTTTPYRIKLYNALSANVTVGTTAPLFTRPVPAAASAGGLACATYDMADIGWYFSTGISWATTTGAADSDATALAAGAGTDISIEYQ